MADRKAYFAAYYQRRKRSRLANRRCLVCGVLIPGATIRRLYCNGTCRQRAHRLSP